MILVEFEDGGTGKEVTFVSGHNLSSIKVLEKDTPPAIATIINSLFRKEQVYSIMSIYILDGFLFYFVCFTA